MPFIPHTASDVQKMLDTMGLTNMQDLFSEIPQELFFERFEEWTEFPANLSEAAMTRLMQDRAPNAALHRGFIGAGAYAHYIPAAVWALASRGEFITAYTPYQAEASQGTLQLIYEYQTLMAGLLSMEVSNASLYDGASALAEAILMAARLKDMGEGTIIVPNTLNPTYRRVLKTLLPAGLECKVVAFDNRTGQIVLPEQIPPSLIAVVIPQPNFLGILEDVDSLTNWAQQNNALAIAVVNPLAMALLKPPGRWGNKGADLVCGEGQPLGIPLCGGGPYFGFLCCRKAFVRQLPGRLIGKTVDTEGRPGYALTLQAREQHIRRAKARSNICTNQGLMVIAATFYLGLMGAAGLQEVCRTSHQRARQLKQLLCAVPEIKPLFQGAFFNEFVIQLPQNQAARTLDAMALQGIQGGFLLSQDYPELPDAVLICATEVHEPSDLQYYQQKLAQALPKKREITS